MITDNKLKHPVKREKHKLINWFIKIESENKKHKNKKHKNKKTKSQIKNVIFIKDCRITKR